MTYFGLDSREAFHHRRVSTIEINARLIHLVIAIVLAQSV